MIITLVQSGGFAGEKPHQIARLDTAALEESRAGQVTKALHRLEQREPEIGADLLRYEITVRDRGSERKVIAFDDGDPANPIYDLLAALQ